MDDGIPVILVTGASRGIGKAIAAHCAKNGRQLVLCARSIGALSDTLEACRQTKSPEPFCVEMDLGCSDTIPALFQDIFRRYGRLDGLVNNAGLLHEGLLGMVKPEDIDRVLAVNVKAPLMLTQYAARLMARRKAGSIINLASIMGVRGAAGLSLYAASKAAVVGMTLSAAKELAPKGIRVNAISPGFIATDMTSSLPQPAYATRLASIGMGRAGTPDEVAELATFLLSDAAAYISGQVIGIDGQMSV